MPTDLSIHLSITPSRFASFELEGSENTIAEVTELCSEYEVGEEKDDTAIIPARFAPCPPGACRATKEKTKKRCERRDGGGPHRLAVNVVEMTCLGADLDDITDEAFGRVLRALLARGLAFWAWETHGHKPGTGRTRARILIPFKEPLPLKHPRQWSQVAWPALIHDIGLDDLARADSACRDAARVYYLPKKPHEGDKHEAGFNPGNAYDWRAVIGDALDGPMPVAGPVEAPEEDPDAPVDLENIRAHLRNIKKPEFLARMVKRILRGEAPSPPPKERSKDEPSRYEAWRSVTAAVANACEGHEARSAVAELLRDSYAAEVAESPSDHTEWDIIESLLETAMDSAPAHKAQKEAERLAANEARTSIIRKRMRQHMKPPDPPGAAVQPSDTGRSEGAANTELARTKHESVSPEGVASIEPAHDAPAHEDDWTEDFLWSTARNGDRFLKQCSANLEKYLLHAPEWSGVLRLNLVTQQIEIHGGPRELGLGVRPFYDEFVTEVTNWFQCLPEEFALKLGDNIVWSQIRSVALKNAYDPIKDYLNGLVWDGVPRLAELLTKYFRARATDDTGELITDYVQAVGRHWAISAVARGLEPGCKVDTVLITEGVDQGEKKSTAFEVLGGAWYTGQHIDLHDKDSWALVAQHWIVELPELETFRKSEVTAQKAFLSLRVDKFRKAYGYQHASYPRRCVFVGSTNRTDYLKDETGNRRFWPVRVGEIDLPALRRDRDQLWAEAVALFKAGGKGKCKACDADVDDRCAEHRWWFTRQEDKALLSSQTEQRMVTDALEEKLVQRITEKDQSARRADYTIHEVLDLLDIDSTRGQEMRVGAVLRRLNFEKKRKRRGGVLAVIWTAPDELLNAPRNSRGGIGGAIARARPEARA